MLIGYARVSTQEQNLDLQTDALQKAGCEKIFSDRKSGKDKAREGLNAALNYLRENDTLVIWKMDRLGRSLKDLIEIVMDLAEKNVGFISLQENIDTTKSGGKLIFHMFGALAEFERDIIRERTMAGLKAARARGRLGGRPRIMDAEKVAMAKTLMDDPNNSIKSICKMLNVSKSTLYRYLKKYNNKENITEEEIKPVEKVIKVKLYLRVERNSKFVRGIKKSKREIEDHVLYYYNYEKLDNEGCEYILTIRYNTEKELDNTIYDIYREMESTACFNNCWTEADIYTLDGEKSW
jgi:DNA invertase Pin-like site-specific DNA recombinase